MLDIVLPIAIVLFASIATIAAWFGKTTDNRRKLFNRIQVTGWWVVLFLFLGIAATGWHALRSNGQQIKRDKKIDSLNKALIAVDKINFPIPKSISFNFHCKYDLDSIKDAELIKYLDSISIIRNKKLIVDSETIQNNQYVSFNYQNLESERKTIIKQLIFFFFGKHYVFHGRKRASFNIDINRFEITNSIH